MLGIEDKFVALAYVLCIASALLCLIYGIVNWNKGDDTVNDEDVRWIKEEEKIEEEL
jgi:hypothetical protein